MIGNPKPATSGSAVAIPATDLPLEKLTNPASLSTLVSLRSLALVTRRTAPCSATAADAWSTIASVSISAVISAISVASASPACLDSEAARSLTSVTSRSAIASCSVRLDFSMTPTYLRWSTPRPQPSSSAWFSLKTRLEDGSSIKENSGDITGQSGAIGPDRPTDTQEPHRCGMDSASIGRMRPGR